MKIAISGPMCSGKSTLAKLICGLNDDYKIYSFGQKIKDLAKELFDMRDIKECINYRTTTYIQIICQKSDE